ncbi:inositol monophosphatase [Jannaschia sp. LMIT008]|uniref:inositol monophosphatase family protein n=1 Tax=Jannaschia maritima TaxID=3032585 RepID=UPI00281161C3|nr:inositol monophosphatase [Jannaschia sp. LMIT008]
MPLTHAQSNAMIAAIREVAAAVILPRFRNLPPGAIDAKSSFDDLVTVADKEAEAALTERFHAILPGDAVVGEESVAADASILSRIGEGRCTIIDPIDGTWNFAHGIANYGVIVAVVEDGRTVWGCLYDPGFDDWVLAVADGGTTFHRNGTARTLSMSRDATPRDRLRGNIGEYMYPQVLRAGLAALTPTIRRSGSLGASLHEYRLMCLGGSDFVLNAFLHPWDHAAGVLAIREAGGVARLLDGTEYAPTMTEGRLLTARTPAIWDELAPDFAAALNQP